MKKLNKKWSMRKMNEGINPSKKVTVTKIKKIFKRESKSFRYFKEDFRNFHLTDAELSKKFRKPKYVISRFRKLSVRWMNGIGRVTKQNFKSDGKTQVKNTLVNLMLDKRSPKSGIVATLPFEFDFEKTLIKISDLNGLNFHGYEFAYNSSVIKESNKRVRRQRKNHEEQS